MSLADQTTSNIYKILVLFWATRAHENGNKKRLRDLFLYSDFGPLPTRSSFAPAINPERPVQIERS